MKSALQFGFLLVFLSFQVGKGFDISKEVNSKEYHSCPNGFYFNDTLQICVSTDIYSCTDYSSSKCPTNTDLDEFCVCQNKYLGILKCPKGAYFDADLLACILVTVEQCQRDYDAFVCPYNTAKDIFCYCQDGKLYQHYCQTGTIFDDKLGTCIDDDDIPESEPSSKKCQRSGLFGDPSDCAGYYTCQDKGSDIKYCKCSAGTIFSLTSFSCVAGTC
ncbi:peritrophin-44-like [Drosophila takahashii]|uniref:peritrophin-44-like n=1 Tax=Drosophila takahashii TaxID=29030 RepID=UPI001CF88E77|nr:uncharacterized protein LOC108070254 [Drosophila takahashii]